MTPDEFEHWKDQQAQQFSYKLLMLRQAIRRFFERQPPDWHDPYA